MPGPIFTIHTKAVKKISEIDAIAMNTSKILGISCFYHDSAACLVEDGRIRAAAQEERFTRKKHDPRFPKRAVAYCLEEAGIKIEDVDHVVFYDKPFLTFERLLLSYLTVAPKGLRSWIQAMPLWLGRKLYIPRVIQKETGYAGDVLLPNTMKPMQPLLIIHHRLKRPPY